jgi:hypothetical protein
VSVGHLRISWRKLFVLTLGEPSESQNLFIFSDTERAAGREKG